jgi:clan AA aspartic protease (TIGR02281 family)
MRCLTAVLLLIPCWLVAQVTVQMDKRDGVFYVPCKVNGLELKFIFDTGASDVSISLAEATFMMKNGYLVESDVLGSQRYQMANGSIEEGVVVNLRQIEIGGRKFQNIKASVSQSLTAPLLLGTAALEGFGTVTVNYQSAVLTLGGASAEPLPLTPSTAKVDPTCKDADGHIYKTVQIGGQTWMAENLRTTRYQNGEQIFSDQSVDWSVAYRGAYCTYGSKASNAPIHGLLYNWFAVNDSRGLCPMGWHIPTEQEWMLLIGYLGGDERAGGPLKSTSRWMTPNFGATNSSGFNALPSGYRTNFVGMGTISASGSYVRGDEGFNNIDESAYFWSISPYNKTVTKDRYGKPEQQAVNFGLYYKTSDANLWHFPLQYGLSCRCLRD